MGVKKGLIQRPLNFYVSPVSAKLFHVAHKSTRKASPRKNTSRTEEGRGSENGREGEESKEGSRRWN